MRWVGLVAHNKVCVIFFGRKTCRKHSLEYIEICSRKILVGSHRSMIGECWLDPTGSVKGPVTGK
jgi:hypothetical protein